MQRYLVRRFPRGGAFCGACNGVEVTKISKSLSLRARIAFGLYAVIGPFLLASAVGVFYLLPSLLAPLEAVVAEFVEELEPVRHLQLALLTAAATTRDRGPGDQRKEFAGAAANVERTFDTVRDSPLFNATEHAVIMSAWREWLKARAIEGEAERRRSHALNATEAQLVAHHAESAASMLDVIYFSARAEIERSQQDAQAAKTRSLWVTLAAICAAFAISVYAAVRLAQPVLSDLEHLRRGALELAQGDLAHRVETFRTPELADLGAAFNAMAVRVQAAQEALSDLAIRDGLTRLLNRREFMRLLDEELERASRYRHPFSLLLIDADHFKQINDRWGHQAGDAVLVQIAERLAGSIRPADRAARYGGEEFATLLPEADADSATRLAERIRTLLGSTPVVLSDGRAIPVTVSVGVATYPSDGTTAEKIIASADAALYMAKSQGRNAVASLGGRTTQQGSA